jgi:hypothetical protein
MAIMGFIATGDTPMIARTLTNAIALPRLLLPSLPWGEIGIATIILSMVARG